MLTFFFTLFWSFRWTFKSVISSMFPENNDYYLLIINENEKTDILEEWLLVCPGIVKHQESSVSRPLTHMLLAKVVSVSIPLSPTQASWDSWNNYFCFWSLILSFLFFLFFFSPNWIYIYNIYICVCL